MTRLERARDVGHRRDGLLVVRAREPEDLAGDLQMIIPHRETFSATTQPPYSSTKG
jgi:hypothetical protein